MPGTFSPPPTSKETAGQRSRHASRHVRDACAVMHVGIANPRWRRKRSRHSPFPSRCMHKPQFHVSGKRPMDGCLHPVVVRKCNQYVHITVEHWSHCFLTKVRAWMSIYTPYLTMHFNNDPSSNFSKSMLIQWVTLCFATHMTSLWCPVRWSYGWHGPCRPRR